MVLYSEQKHQNGSENLSFDTMIVFASTISRVYKKQFQYHNAKLMNFEHINNKFSYAFLKTDSTLNSWLDYTLRLRRRKKHTLILPNDAFGSTIVTTAGLAAVGSEGAASDLGRGASALPT